MIFLIEICIFLLKKVLSNRHILQYVTNFFCTTILIQTSLFNCLLKFTILKTVYN